MQLASPQDSISEKISSSVKKSHKISIYSKKSTKSPKKYEQQTVSRIQETKDFHAVLMMTSDKFNEVNGLNGLRFNQNNSVSNNNGIEISGGSHRNINVIDISNRGLATRQQSYQQPRQQNSFFDTTIPMIKKGNTLTDNINTFMTGTQQNNNYQMNSNNGNGNNKSNAKNNPSNYYLQSQQIHNISQMIEKEVESQTNNFSVLEGSFLTGVKNTSFSQNPISNNPYYNISKNKDSQNLQNSQNSQGSPRQMMNNMMKFMHEQIFIAKQKCEKRVNQMLKDNAKLINDLKDKLVKNQVLLREKAGTIERMKEVVKRGNMINNSINNNNGKKVHSQGLIDIKKEMLPKQVYRLHNIGDANGYYEKRVADLSSKLTALQSTIICKSQNQQQLDIEKQLQLKIQILQKQLITYNHSKLKKLSIKLQSFICHTSQKVQYLSQEYQKLRVTFEKCKKEEYGLNEKKVKQQKLRVTNVEKELQDFMGKEFKYENFNIPQLQEEINCLKQHLRIFENKHFQNSKLIKQLILISNNNQPSDHEFIIESNNQPSPQQNHLLSQNLNYYPQPSQKPFTKLITLSNVNQTTSKYTLTNPNMSKISISQLSDTHQYSHLIQKVAPNQNPFMPQNSLMPSNNYHHDNTINNYHNNNTSNDESLISMNFTEEPSDSIAPRIKRFQSVNCLDKYNQKNIDKYNQNNKGAMSKYTKNTDLKQTCSQLQATPPSASKYYLPTTKASISINSITILPNQSSTQQKIRNLNDLKMQTLPMLHTTKQTPQKYNNQQNSSKKFIYYRNLSQIQQSLDQNNASYLSIGQMEDFNLSRRDIVNQTSDFSDDEFFYPGYRDENVCEWESPQKSYKTTERFLETEEFSPMKKKLTLTQQHFYQSTKSPQPNTMQQSREKPNFMYNSSLDYEQFSDEQDDNHKEITRQEIKKIPVNQVNESVMNNPQNKPYQNICKVPSPLTHQKQQQNFTQNQQRIITSLKNMKKNQLPVKMIYDRKKCQGVMRTLDAGHMLNGKTCQLHKKEVEKLQALGYVQVKTYI